MQLTGEILSDLELEFNPCKTQVTHFDHGFKFLGHQFIRSMVFKAQAPTNDTVASSVKRAEPLPTPAALSEHRNAMALAWQVALDKHKALDKQPELAEHDEPPQLAQDIEAELTTEQQNGVQLDSLQRTLYLSRNDLRISKTSQRLILKWDEQQRLVPLIHIDQIVVLGNAQFSTPAIRACLKAKVTIHFLNASGYYQGQISRPNLQRCLLHKAQYRRQAQGLADGWQTDMADSFDDDMADLLGDTTNTVNSTKPSSDERFALAFGIALLRAKLHNSVTLLRRVKRRSSVSLASSIEQQIKLIAQQRAQLLTANKLESLRGMEGAAARAYFFALGALFEEHGWQWQGRQARPANDALNIMFNFVYSLLYNNVISLVYASGLNPYIGYLHQLKANHAALASDLMEPFRSMVADQIVISCVRDKHLNAELFEPATDSGRISSEAVAEIIKRFEKRINQTYNYSPAAITAPENEPTSRKLDMRRIIADQVNQTKRWVLGEVSEVNFFELK